MSRSEASKMTKQFLLSKVSFMVAFKQRKKRVFYTSFHTQVEGWVLEDWCWGGGDIPVSCKIGGFLLNTPLHQGQLRSVVGNSPTMGGNPTTG